MRSRSNIRVARELVAMARQILAENDKYLFKEVMDLNTNNLQDDTVESSEEIEMANRFSSEIEGAETLEIEADDNSTKEAGIYSMVSRVVNSICRKIDSARIYLVRGANGWPGYWKMNVSGDFESGNFIPDGSLRLYGAINIMISLRAVLKEFAGRNRPVLVFNIMYKSEKTGKTYDVYKGWLGWNLVGRYSDTPMCLVVEDGCICSCHSSVLREAKSMMQRFMGKWDSRYSYMIENKIRDSFRYKMMNFLQDVKDLATNPLGRTSDPYSLE